MIVDHKLHPQTSPPERQVTIEILLQDLLVDQSTTCAVAGVFIDINSAACGRMSVIEATFGYDFW